MLYYNQNLIQEVDQKKKKKNPKKKFFLLKYTFWLQGHNDKTSIEIYILIIRSN